MRTRSPRAYPDVLSTIVGPADQRGVSPAPTARRAALEILPGELAECVHYAQTLPPTQPVLSALESSLLSSEGAGSLSSGRPPQVAGASNKPFPAFPCRLPQRAATPGVAAAGREGVWSHYRDS